MSTTYEQLSSTVDDIVTQAILAEMRIASTGTVAWSADSKSSPTTVTYGYSSGMASAKVTLDWATGSEIDSETQGPGSSGAADGAAGTFQGWKSKWQEKIPHLFTRFEQMPDPDDFGKEYLWQVGTERSKLNDWNGAAAKAFRDKYLKTWPRNLSNQFAALCLIKLSMEREAALWKTAREQISLTADHAVSAMKGADGPPADDTVALAIFTGAAGVTTLVVPLAGQIALAAIVGAIGVHNALESRKKEEPTMAFGADTPDGVYDKMAEGLGRFDLEIMTTEVAIDSDLQDLEKALVERDPFLGTGADDLVGTTDPGDVGLAGDHIEVGEIENLRTVAGICIHASEDARTAARHLVIDDPAGVRSRPSDLGDGPAGPTDRYLNCVDLLQDIIADNGVIIGDCGENLDAAANTYSDTDQDSERQMKDRSDDLDEAREDDGDLPVPPPSPHEGGSSTQV